MATVDLTAHSRSPETVAIRQQEHEDLLRMVGDLTPLKREVVFLKFVEKLSNAEIAKVLNKSEGAIKSIYHRTLLELREKIDADQFS